MRAVIDPDGRVILPASIREEAGLPAGSEVDIRVRDGVVELAPVELPVHLERRKYLLVAVPDEPVDPLTSEEVAAVRHGVTTLLTLNRRDFQDLASNDVAIVAI